MRDSIRLVLIISAAGVAALLVWWIAQSRVGAQLRFGPTALLGDGDVLPRRESGPSDRDLELAALENLSPLPFASQWFPQSDKELDRQQRWINEKRAWVSTITDRRVRKAYLGWIDYAQTRLNENREENRTHAERDAFQARQKARADKWSRAAGVARTIPKPQ